jgi:streptogramin lyase
MVRRFLLLVLAIASLSGATRAANATAGQLAGIVTSDAEGPMEGVLVSAKQSPGTITVTVVSDSKGRYTFPPGRLAPGKYLLSIRAIGYEAAEENIPVAVGKGKREKNLKLHKTQALASQLSDVEWLMSVPGTEQQKEYLFLTCSQCHTLAPVMKSTYDAAGWMVTLTRMNTWDQISKIDKPVKNPDRRGGGMLGNKEFAEYLSSINLSAHATNNFELKTLPRPRGADTKVIVTEYDLPRHDAEPHDVSPDKSGRIWYSDFLEGIIGRLNAATGEVKEWQDPVTKAGYPSAFQCLEWDPQGNLWVGRHNWNGIAKFDVKAERFTDFNIPSGRADFISVGRDGTVWVKDTASDFDYRIDPMTGEPTKFNQLPDEFMNKTYEGPRHHPYGITADSNGNLYEADISGGDLYRVEGATGKVSRFTPPTPNSGPRRMHLDTENRVWIGEYYAKTIAVFDPKTEKFQEWPITVPWYGPYDVVADKQGNVWAGGMTSELIVRLDPKTGEFRKYLLPRLGVNVRRVEVDNTGARPVLWVGENHQAKIAKVETLD